jgi:hypothetical protein
MPASDSPPKLAELFARGQDGLRADSLLEVVGDRESALEFARACDLAYARAILHREHPGWGISAAEVVDGLRKLAYRVADYKLRGYS